ncbi:hypothetical protein CE91St68_07220 [Methanobrevibacter smithii]|nr:hypothetical protein [Methanobrevibacter smithii]BDF81243.1 hypothetical protein CE91St67_15190 [Methanobrevibacter smithii]BDF82165.1 hypothetical protein CE91St68_07220 [Methanobrevibacter smithii]
MLIKIMDILAGLKMTIVSGIFLLCAVICMVSGIESPIDPAWGAVIISGIPLFYLALYRLIFEKWVSSALLITIAMVASLVIGEIFAAAEVAWIMALGALLEDWTVERAKKGLKNLIELTPQTGRLICNENGKKQEKIIVHNAGSCLVVLNAALLYDRNFDKNRIHSHYHYHDDGKHAHSHENVEILGEIHTSEGVKHIHSHRHSLKFKSHCSKL